MLKRRAAVATVTLCVLIVQLFSPALAETPTTDPRLVDLIKHGCGDAPASKPTPEARTYHNIPGRVVLLGFNQAEASPTPSAESTAQPTTAPTNAPVTPPPTPLPPAPPGPGQLIPPAPRGSALPTPPPPPSPTPVPGQTGPVFLIAPTSSPPALPAAGGTATPLPRAVPTAAGPTPIPTLAPFQIAIFADLVHGFNREHEPGDATGNVHIFYSEGQLIGDRAHYDGDHTITITGHTYLINRNQDAILYADSITFDTNTHKATLVNGRGETTEGIQRGKLHYKANTLSAYQTGVSHGDRGWFTTCENAHSGYHVEAKVLDVFPGKKLTARHATVFLGPLAIFYLPFLAIPLRDVQDVRRPTNFLPVIGYSQLEGYFIKLRLGFNPSDTYYGYYRVEYYTKRGLGLGYAAFLGTKHNQRWATIDGFTIKDRLVGGRQTNLNFAETENISSRLRTQLQAQYTGNFGSGLALPPLWQVNGTINHVSRLSNETLTFQRTTQGTLSNTFNVGLVDMLTLSQALQESINVTYGRFSTQGGAATNTLHLQSLLHWFTKPADYNLQYDKTDYSSASSSYDRVPELQVLPHINFHGFRFPFTTQFTLGQYTEPQNHFSTQRAELRFNEPVFFKVGASDFHATYNIVQDYYGTGDAKAYDTQYAQFTTPLGSHMVNTISYNEQHPIGPANVPFQLIDRLSGGSHSAAETFRIFNGDVYTLSLSTNTFFNRQAQAIAYQLNLRPSLRSYMIFGGSWLPGPGQGFLATNVQGITPLGKYITMQYSTNVNWKAKGRLQNKTVFLSDVIGDCYRLDLSYNQDLKTVNFYVTILAFPGRTVGGTLGGSITSIIPQNFGGF